VYYNRLQRDGWVMSKNEYQGATLFEKKLPKSWLLRKPTGLSTGGVRFGVRASHALWPIA
jgi:hypothetical protein